MVIRMSGAVAREVDCGSSPLSEHLTTNDRDPRPIERDPLGRLVSTARGLSQDSDPEALIDWGKWLAEHQDDPELTAALFERLGPTETARLLRLTGFAADRSQTYATEMVDTFSVFKTALANGSTRLADARGFADEFGRWLLPTELSEHENADLMANGGLPLTGPAVLAQILRGTSFAPGFLSGLAARVERFERSGKVDPADYYKLMTPARFDGYQARDIPALIFGQLSHHKEQAADDGG